MILRVVLLSLAAAHELRAGVTPVQKVITLLQDMRSTSVTEKKDEEVAFTKFKGWCDHTTTEKQKRVKEAEELMSQLEADIMSAESDVAELTQAMADLDAEMDQYRADMKAATEVREKEHADYEATHKDYTESVDAVSRAVSVLGQQNFDRKQAAALLQEVSSHKFVPIVAKRTFAAFVTTTIKDPWDEEQPTGLSVSAPQAAAYQFQSGGVIDMLKKLKDKFSDERTTLEKEEMSQKQSYELLIQDLTDSVERATKAKGRKEKTRGQRQEDAANAKGELADTTASRDEDQKYLDETVSGCQLKSADYESRQSLRAEELEALDKAIEILASGSVSGAADTHLPALVQQAFALRASMSAPAQRAAEFLQTRAAKIQSQMLSMLAAKVSAGDPFDKVKKMIKDMIVRLMEEATEESEHKGWCDSELGTNKITRESKTEDVNSLSAQADQLSADIAKLGQEIAELTATVAELDASVKEATELREKEKAKNAATVSDAKEASLAVQQATAVLKDFYAKAAEATALVQADAPNALDDAPATFDSAYQGKQAESGGVLGMLEVIASDFERLETDTTMEEEQAAKEYKKFTNEAAVDRAQKTTDISNKQKLSTKKSGELQTTKSDLKSTQEELDAAMEYYDKLKPSCVDAGVSYEERVQRRADEIESLQEALKILSGEDI
jgi:hypothetical protein